MLILSGDKCKLKLGFHRKEDEHHIFFYIFPDRFLRSLLVIISTIIFPNYVQFIGWLGIEIRAIARIVSE